MCEPFAQVFDACIGLCIEGGQHEGHFFRKRIRFAAVFAHDEADFGDDEQEYGIDRIRLFFLYIGAHLVEIPQRAGGVAGMYAGGQRFNLWFDFPMNGIV